MAIYTERACEGCPAHGQTSKDMTRLTSKEKPMLRAGKSTIQRRIVNTFDTLYDLTRIKKRRSLSASVGINSQMEYVPHSADSPPKRLDSKVLGMMMMIYSRRA